ncbi:MAG: biopolymer transporter ExbD [Phycisphaeraceae bacterium]|nr:biopolymer transporter ExbD [Phycisphaeraceae bacterium]
MRTRIRRSMPEVRFEMTPLIDVMFLLVTYFVFALVLMIRADVIDLTLPDLRAGHTATGTAITVAVGESGAIAVNGETVELEKLIEVIRARQEETPEAALLLAFDTRASMGTGLAVVDALMGAGISRFSMVGNPANSDAARTRPPETGE